MQIKTISSRAFHTSAALLLVTVVLTTVIVYWSGLDGPFLLDDAQNIVNAYVADFDPHAILYAVTHNDSGTLGRPVSMLSLVFSGIVHGPGTWGYKYHNLLIHLLNGLLLFWLLLKLMPLISAGFSREKSVLVAGLTASLWLLHPLMISTVLYAVQRMEQLSALFTLAALLTYVFFRSSIDRCTWKFLVLTWAGFLLATMLAAFSKENGALIPFYVLAIDMIAFGFNSESRRGRKRLAAFFGVFVALPVVLGSLYVVTHFDKLTDYSLRDFTLTDRLMTQLHVVVFYLKLILLPRLSDMSLFHDDVAITRQMDLSTLLLLLLLLLAVAAVFLLRRKAPVLAFAIGWFLISHLMESTFISLEMVFEHRNYLAAAGPLLALVYYLFRTPVFHQLKYVYLPILILFVFLTVSRVQVWKSLPMMYQMAVIEHPSSLRANTEFANLNYNSGSVELALQYLDIAQELNRKDFGAILHEIVYRCGRGEDMSGLLEEARTRAANHPVSPYALNGLDNLIKMHTQDRCPEVSLDQALKLVKVAIRRNTNVNEQYLGYLERIEGRILILQGKYIDGVRNITKAYEYTGMPVILIELADIQLNLDRLDDARQLIAYLEEINEASYGVETAKLAPLKEKLAKLKAEKQQEVGDEGSAMQAEIQ